jgi:hypothetical protein
MNKAGISNESKIVWLICLAAALHVFIFSATFPFFNVVDEAEHFDLVVKYSQGDIPRIEEKLSADSCDYTSFYHTWEYLVPPQWFTNGEYPPTPWTQPAGTARTSLDAARAGWEKQDNYEVSQTPLYYAICGAWWRAGEWLGFSGGRWLYTLRFLNMVFVVAMIWLAYHITRMIFPGNSFLQLGVAALIAFMPQTAFYSIGNDVLSPLCFGATFLCLVKWQSAERPSAWHGVATGLAFAATYLAKATNIPLLAVVAFAVAIKACQSFQKHKWPAAIPCLAFILCAIPPILGWMFWCKIHFGDFTGAKMKMDYFGWTIKPLAEWWHHPIFTPRGFWIYLSGQIGTFWQGEFWWHHRSLSLPGTYFIYTTISLALIVITGYSLLVRSTEPAQQSHALQLSLACIVAGLGFFALMSIAYDFHNCPYPSRQHPYFTSGRLLLGALIPFFILIVYGLDRALDRFGTTVKYLTFAILVSFMVAGEIATDWPIFFNPYNWFILQ